MKCTYVQSLKIFFKLKKRDAETITQALTRTASFNFEHESLLEKMIGLIARKENVFWAEMHKFLKSKMDIVFYYALQPLSIMTSHFLKHLKPHRNNKSTIFTITTKRETELQSSLD